MKIPVLHLEEGIHRAEQQIKAAQVQFGNVKNYPTDIKLNVTLNKFDKNLVCSVELETTASYTCDRCLTEFTQELEESFEILFFIGTDELKTEEDEVVIVPPETVEIDLVPYIREYLLLAIPMKTVCSDQCKGLCPNCGVDLNKNKCKCNIDSIDPRWEQLKKLKTKNSK